VRSSQANCESFQIRLRRLRCLVSRAGLNASFRIGGGGGCRGGASHKKTALRDLALTAPRQVKARVLFFGLDPSGQRRAIEINSETRKDLRLPVQRRVIAVFADQDLREERWRRQAACDRALRRRRLRYRSASAAAVFGAVE